jgi:hypothetical protein
MHLFGPEECPVCAAMSDLRTDRDRLNRALDRQTRVLARTLTRLAELEHQLEVTKGGERDEDR